MNDDLWALIERLLPPWPERSPGPRAVADWLCVQGILYVLFNDIAWQLLPLESRFGSGQTCWRRLDRWQQARVFDQLHQILLAELKRPANSTGPRHAWTAPTSARKRGPRHRPVAARPAEDGQQTPPDLRRTRRPRFKVITTAANVNDVTQTLALDDGIPPNRGQARPAPPAPRSPARRQGLRLQPEPGRAAQTPDPARDLPARAARTSRAWASSATSSSRPSPCPTSSNDLPSAGKAAPNSRGAGRTC
ncbi:transposase [Streptomyces sp. NPDC054961]